MSIYHEARGRQIDIGGTVIQIPQHPPVTDAEALHLSELVAHVDKAIRPHNLVADTGKKVIDGLHEDVTAYMRQKIERPAEPGLFDGVHSMGPDASVAIEARGTEVLSLPPGDAPEEGGDA